MFHRNMPAHAWDQEAKTGEEPVQARFPALGRRTEKGRRRPSGGTASRFCLPEVQGTACGGEDVGHLRNQIQVTSQGQR